MTLATVHGRRLLRFFGGGLPLALFFGGGLLLALGACVAPGQARRVPRPDDPLVPPAREQGVALTSETAPRQDDLARRMVEAHRDLGHGRPPVTELLRGALGTGQEQGYTVRLNAAFCYSLIAVSAQRGVELDLLLFDRRGDEIGRDTRPRSVAAVEVCPPQGSVYRVVVRMFRGGGAFALQLFGS